MLAGPVGVALVLLHLLHFVASFIVKLAKSKKVTCRNMSSAQDQSISFLSALQLETHDGLTLTRAVLFSYMFT